MSITIRLARTPSEIDALFQTRYEVFHREEGYFPERDDGRVFDRFDAWPTVANFVAIHEGEVVGGIRMCRDEGFGTPADAYFDFRPHLPHDAKLASASLFCVKREHRNRDVALGLMLMGTYYAFAHGASHIVAPINPVIGRMLRRVNFIPVGTPMTEPETGLPTEPLVLSIDNLIDAFFTFASRNALLDFVGDFERTFYRAGEVVLRAGDPGTTAHIVTGGRAQVRLPNSSTVLGTLGEGEVFGEIGLLTGAARLADVVAETDLSVMTLGQEAFFAQLHTQPKQAITWMKQMGFRMRSMVGQLAPQAPSRIQPAA